jgi:hypothetical protein
VRGEPALEVLMFKLGHGIPLGLNHHSTMDTKAAKDENFMLVPTPLFIAFYLYVLFTSEALPGTKIQSQMSK